MTTTLLIKTTVVLYIACNKPFNNTFTNIKSNDTSNKETEKILNS